MFQSLASYFYGSTSESDNQPDSTRSSSNNIGSSSTGAPSLELVASAQLDKNAKPAVKTTRLVTKPCDEHNDADETEVSDWLLVDKEGILIKTTLHVSQEQLLILNSFEYYPQQKAPPKPIPRTRSRSCASRTPRPYLSSSNNNCKCSRAAVTVASIPPERARTMACSICRPPRCCPAAWMSPGS